MRVLICGAAGRDFHEFLVSYRDDPSVEVVAFTATQIPTAAGRRFPAALAGPRYPRGIPIHPEEQLRELVVEHHVDRVVLAYSDVSVEHVAELASVVVSAGAELVLPGTRSMLRSVKPVLGVGAVRTGCGKSQTVRWFLDRLAERGVKAVALRHPMPYDPDLSSQRVQRFASPRDLDLARCTIEEREEYAPYVERGRVVWSGIDTPAVLAAAEGEADLIVWDGGNNDLPFVRPDLHVVLTDPHRSGHALTYWPGRAQLLLADVVLVAKRRTARDEDVLQERRIVEQVNPRATVIEVDSRLTLDGADESTLRGKRVIVIEDGPTTTHGGMTFGAATLLARRAGAEIVDPRPHFVGALAGLREQYPHLGRLVPAFGYSEEMRADLRATLGRIDADLVLSGTPADLSGIVPDPQGRPMLRVRYDLEELPGQPSLAEILDRWLEPQLGATTG